MCFTDKVATGRKNGPKSVVVRIRVCLTRCNAIEKVDIEVSVIINGVFSNVALSTTEQIHLYTPENFQRSAVTTAHLAPAMENVFVKRGDYLTGFKCSLQNPRDRLKSNTNGSSILDVSNLLVQILSGEASNIFHATMRGSVCIFVPQLTLCLLC
jgi:hypothetical protein